jgi:hypothetical protein
LRHLHPTSTLALREQTHIDLRHLPT